MDTRNTIIARGMRAGMTQRAIAAQIGCSAPAVAQRIRRCPELRRLRRCSPQAIRGIRHYRRQLRLVQLEAQAVARRIGKAIKTLDEELELAEIEQLLAG
jgi:DNA-binding Lrp family transcriptional regulator